MQPQAKLRVYTPTTPTTPTTSTASGLTEHVVSVTPTTTLQQILSEIKFEWDDAQHVFMNEGKTPMPWLDRTIQDYNNWYIESGGFIPSIYVTTRGLITD